MGRVQKSREEEGWGVWGKTPHLKHKRRLPRNTKARTTRIAVAILGLNLEDSFLSNSHASKAEFPAPAKKERYATQRMLRSV